jgi:hypothetical protein
LNEAKLVAREKAEAEDREAKDRAMESTDPATLLTGSGPSVALVLADRARALALAYDASRGITPASRAKWAEDNEKFAAQWREEAAAKAKEIADCTKCRKAKRGRCNDHVIRMGRRSYSTSSRIGDDMGYWHRGHSAGMKADLGSGPSVSSEAPKAL